MDKKCAETNGWNSTIESISLQLGSISASSSSTAVAVVADSQSTSALPYHDPKKRKNTGNENRAWKSKEKSLSEEPMGLEGLRRAEERRKNMGSANLFSSPFRQGDRKSCRLRFKSPSDNSQCQEKPNLHLVSLVKHNQLTLRNRTRLSTSASESSLLLSNPPPPPIVDNTVAVKKLELKASPIPKIVEGQVSKCNDEKDESPTTRRQSLKRKVKIDQ